MEDILSKLSVFEIRNMLFTTKQKYEDIKNDLNISIAEKENLREQIVELENWLEVR